MTTKGFFLCAIWGQSKPNFALMTRRFGDEWPTISRAWGGIVEKAAEGFHTEEIG
jgi:hypothetical protein